MVLFIILGVIVLTTFIVLGGLFFMLAKEEQKKTAFEPKISLLTGQLDEAQQRIETLTKENGSFKNQQVHLEQAQQKLLESTNAKVRLLEEEISRANATVSELNREKEALLSASKPQPDEDPLPSPPPLLPRTPISRHEGEGTMGSSPYKGEGNDEALRHELESLKYELIKARAQSSGLERVSFNYKNQLEDFFKKVNAVQVSNDHLSQVKNRLEEIVQEVKLQNEELVKKDQLAQFELEKNRSRLTSLEREYEDFKARTHQKDSQV